MKKGSKLLVGTKSKKMFYNCEKCNYTPRPHTPSIFDNLGSRKKTVIGLMKLKAKHQEIDQEQKGLNLDVYY